MPQFHTTLWYDTETFSWEDLRKAGVYRYSEKGEIIMAQWAVDDGPVQVADTFNGHKPPELIELLQDPGVLVRAHNAPFDRTMTRNVWGIDVPIERWRCTMAQAMSHGLPGGLDKLSEIFALGLEGKMKIERALMVLFCTPRPKNHKLRRATPDTHPEEWQRFLEYGEQDVVAMRALFNKMPRWNYDGDPTETAVWFLDQKINDRGFAVDVELAEASIRTVGIEQKRLAKETRKRTSGEVAKPSQRDAILAHVLTEYGIVLDNLRADTLRRLVSDPEIPEPVQELLALRLESTKTSTAKYAALLRSVCHDDRIRGALAYCGAIRTGRWAGRILQPQNFPRPTKEVDAEYMERGIEAFKAGAADLLYDNVMQVSANLIRGVIVAPPGKKLIPSDWSNIEGRSLAQLAGEEWKLEAFRLFDRGEGPDLYVAAYARAFNIAPEEVGGGKRQIGKVLELALGYEGGAGAFLTFAAVYNMDLEEMAAAVKESVSKEAWDAAASFVEWMREENGRDLPVSEDVEIASEVLKAAWREAHPHVVAFWREAQEAFKNAALHANKTFRCGADGCIQIRRTGAWLRVRLPSGRQLCYLKPRIDSKGNLRYMGVHPLTRRWCELYTYGGKLVENFTQAFARDVMAYHMPRLEERGYALVLTVHDEPIAEVPDTEDFSADEMCKIMTEEIPWARGLPLAAGGFETYRYRKE